MSISMYQISIPVMIRALTNLVGVLKKGEAFAESKKINPSILINDRLAPDMFPLTRQVQIATDIARRGAARLAGMEAPKLDDNEQSFADLYARINSTIDYLKGFKPEQIDGTENKAISFEVRGNKTDFTGQQMLLHFTLPNVFFHVTTAYAILRHNGVDIGKADYLGKMPA